MSNPLEKALSTIKRPPALSCLILLFLWWFWPESAPKVHSEGRILHVEDGFKYRKSPEMTVEVFPFLMQKRLIGTPEEAGVSSALYYVTKSDLESAKSEFHKNGGCWPSTFSSYKREFLLVGDPKKVTHLMGKEGPPPLEGSPKFITLKGNRLTLLSSTEDAQVTSHIAHTRNADFFALVSAWK